MVHAVRQELVVGSQRPAVAVVVAVVVVHVEPGIHIDGLADVECVAEAEVEGAAVAHRLRLAEGAGTSQIVLAFTLALGVYVLPLQLEFHVVGDALLGSMPRKQTTDALHVSVTRGLRAVALVTLAVVVDVFVQIVGTSKEHGAGAVGEAHAEAFQPVSLVGTIARFQLG